jgi:hypothetical protein
LLLARAGRNASHHQLRQMLLNLHAKHSDNMFHVIDYESTGASTALCVAAMLA